MYTNIPNAKREFLRFLALQYLRKSLSWGFLFLWTVVLCDHVVGAAAIRLVFAAGLFCGGDAVAVAGALEVGHVAGSIAVAQLTIAAGAAQTIVGFGGHGGSP